MKLYIFLHNLSDYMLKKFKILYLTIIKEYRNYKYKTKNVDI